MDNLKEIVEGSISGIAQETIDENTYYNITMADGGITNAQMAQAILHPELFNVGDVYQCIDSGTYTENHFYKFTGSAWVDTTIEWGYPILSGASDPTTSTVGLVNQLYRNTTTNVMFVCTAVTTGTPDTYTWVKINGDSYETYTISSWSALASSEPYTYSATVTATYTISANTVVELINDQPVLFGTYGFAVGAVSGQSVTIYSIGEPSTDVTLKIGYGG